MVNIVSQMFWKKNDIDAEVESLSSRAMTFSKNSPVSSSRPGSRASVNDFVRGRKAV